MATKKTKKITTSRTYSEHSVVRACTYLALVIAAGIFLFRGLIAALEIGALTRLLSTLNLIGQILLAIGIAFPAYDFTCGKRRIWRIIFWIALVVYVLGCVFGVLKF